MSSAKNGTRRAVVKRDDDLLTPEGIKRNWEDVKAAGLLEFRAQTNSVVAAADAENTCGTSSARVG